VGECLTHTNHTNQSTHTHRHRATLCQAEGSALAALFSPRWFGADGGEALPRDREGVPFLDYDPACFRLLLTYLRYVIWLWM
jgi:hypothetical protein